jgi:hypothetical protein
LDVGITEILQDGIDIRRRQARLDGMVDEALRDEP